MTSDTNSPPLKSENSSYSHRLLDLITELQKVMNAPIHPEAMELGKGAVFVTIKDGSGKIVMSRGHLKIVDYGSYVSIEAKL